MIRVTDHALIRFIECAGGLDLEGLRSSLARSLEDAEAVADRLNANSFVLKADGLSYVVRGRALVTVCGKDSPHGDGVV